MSENERLREALRDMIELSMEDNSMWELHDTSFRERRRAARNALAAKPEVFADRLNALERDNSTLNAELTETIAAVSDLMDENADLRRKLAEAYERVAKMADEWAQTEIAAGTDKGYAQIMEVFAEEVRSLIPPKEATDE